MGNWLTCFFVFFGVGDGSCSSSASLERGGGNCGGGRLAIRAVSIAKRIFLPCKTLPSSSVQQRIVYSQIC
jgi:hypothetical protein